MNITTHTSQIHLRQQITALEQERQALPDISPIQIEQQIQHTAARALVQPELKTSLADLIHSKHLAEKALERRQEINSQIARINVELDLLEGEEKRHAVEMADKRMAEAHNEFRLAALNTVRAYRRAINIGRQNAGIPGATTKLPPAFDFQHLRSAYGSQQFSTSQEMAMGYLRIEMDDQQQDKVAA